MSTEEPPAQPPQDPSEGGPPPSGPPRPGDYPPPGHYPPPGQHPPPGQYGPPGAVPPPSPYPYPPPYAYPQPVSRGTNGLAIASLVLGILWVYWIGSILALVFGYVGKNQIDRTGGLQSGRGMAIAGIVLGWIGVGTLILVIVLIAIGTTSGPY